MRGLLLASMLLLLAPVARGEGEPSGASHAQADDAAYVAAYHALKPEDLEKKRAAALPEQEELRRIDVSQRIRSASFGHKTTLLVPAKPGSKREFYVQYGKSTNRPAQLFGPFSL